MTKFVIIQKGKMLKHTHLQTLNIQVCKRAKLSVQQIFSMKQDQKY